MLNSVFPNLNFVKFEFYSNFILAYGRVSLFWFLLYAYNILYNMAFNYVARSHFTLIDCMLYNVVCYNMNVLFIVCVTNIYKVKIADKFQAEIWIPNVCNSNFKTEVRKVELYLTFLVLTVFGLSICL